MKQKNMGCQMNPSMQPFSAVTHNWYLLFSFIEPPLLQLCVPKGIQAFQYYLSRAIRK